MTPGLELALGAMVCLGIADLAYKHGAAAGVQARHFLMVQGWCFAPAIALYGLLTGTLALATPMLWGMGAGLFVFIALYNFARSLRSGSVSIIAPIFRMSFTVTAALAVLLLGGEGAAAPGPGAARSSLAQALVAMAAMGVANFLYKVGAQTGGTPATFITGQAIVFIFLSTGFVWKADRVLRPPARAWLYAGTAAAVFLLALVLMFESLARGEASVLVPITQMGFVVTAAVGLIFLREPFTARKAAGLLFAVAALASLAYS